MSVNLLCYTFCLGLVDSNRQLYYLKEADLDKQFVSTDLMNYITSCTACIVGLVISESGLEDNS